MIQDAYERMDYDAFGNQWNGNLPDPFGYCGEYYDNESGLIYLRNRYYDSSDGRFITEDPVKDGENWYNYCAGNPVTFVDPDGLADVLVKYIIEKNGGRVDYDEWTHQAIATLGKVTKKYNLSESNVLNGRLVLDDSVLQNDFKLKEKQVHHEPEDKFDCADDAALAWALTYYDESNTKKREYISLILSGYNTNRLFYTFSSVNEGLKYESFIDYTAKPPEYNNVSLIHSHPFVGDNSYSVSDPDKSFASNTNYGYYGFIYVVTPKEILKYNEDTSIKSIKYK